MTAANGAGRAMRSARADTTNPVVLREEIETLLARMIERGEELRDRVKGLDPGHPREALLAAILRLTEKAREERAELRRVLG